MASPRSTCLLTDLVLHSVAEQIPAASYTKLGMLLGFSFSELQNIEVSLSNRQPDCISRCLVQWRNSNGDGPEAANTLIRILEKAELRYFAIQLQTQLEAQKQNQNRMETRAETTLSTAMGNLEVTSTQAAMAMPLQEENPGGVEQEANCNVQKPEKTPTKKKSPRKTSSEIKESGKEENPRKIEQKPNRKHENKDPWKPPGPCKK